MPDPKVTRLLAALTVAAIFGSAVPGPMAAQGSSHRKLDRVLQERATSAAGQSRVIIRLKKGVSRTAAKDALKLLGVTSGRILPIINGQAASLPNAALAAVANSPLVEHVSFDRVILGTMERTSAAIGAAAVRESLGLNGAGIGVAIVDSGITAWHDDLGGAPESSQRVDRFVDLVGQRATAYDDYGHGTHVAGIVAGNGFDSEGRRTGIAPAARLIVIKALDGNGQGRISDVIAALDYIVANKAALNIRVANLSVSAPAYEPYDTDPLTLAAKRAVNAGIVVVAAAGNIGRSAQGTTLYAGVGAPGNAPWVVTVGASSHNGTIGRADDTIASFSSRGPGAGGYAAKPDLVAPGVGIESLSDPDSLFYTSRASHLLTGTVPTPYIPYMSLSGTSMSAPVVSGTVALMLQANPSLTPNQVKAILQYTAEVNPDYDGLTQGAGFLNAKGAVELARYFADPSIGPRPQDASWGKRLIWGNYQYEGGALTRDASAWSTSVTWGDTATAAGMPVAWGVTEGGDVEREWNVGAAVDNVVWGLTCGGSDCSGTWSSDAVLGTDTGDTVVWGMDELDTVVWGMNCLETKCTPVIWSDR